MQAQDKSSDIEKQPTSGEYMQVFNGAGPEVWVKEKIPELSTQQFVFPLHND